MGGATILWALLTGAITGGTWVAIVLVGRQKRLAELQAAMRHELEGRLDQLDQVDARVAELEERLDFAERLLAEERETRRLAPPDPPRSPSG